ncbi:MAG: RNA-binding S4 domain-containing protein [Clostridiales bacterium]|nr:RNA-binding S4 domain-containing protein [Clostridiales bacterium]
MEKIGIHTEFIKLNQLLKWAGIAHTGAHANEIIGEGLVQVNGEVETRRGRKIYDGDTILMKGEDRFLIVKEG